MSKYKVVRFMTPKGERKLQFKPVDAEPGKLICDMEGVCAYEAICSSLLPDPRDPDNKDVTFNDFCASLGTEEDGETDLYQMAPVEGTIEQNLSDFPDIIGAMLSDDPLIRLSTFIHGACADSCDYYKPDLSGCTAKNKMCLINGVLAEQKNMLMKKKEEGENDATD